MTCERFRDTFASDSLDEQQLEHLRSCDACLDFAIGIDPDVMFRAIGGETMVPPGGVDAFVSDVMRQVQVRAAEESLDRHRRVLSWPRRLAVAATLVAGITGAALVSRQEAPSPGLLVPIARAQVHPLTTKPVIESYQSERATIVEVPTDSADTQVVMIFDESLPADL